LLSSHTTHHATKAYHAISKTIITKSIQSEREDLFTAIVYEVDKTGGLSNVSLG